MVVKIVGHAGTVHVAKTFGANAQANEIADNFAYQRQAEIKKAAAVVHTAPDNSPER